ncbi:hypothetical protein HNO83_07470 [Leifsonia sp. C5G2]|nr:hypothetical protein [Leifsonia sp. C5G2]
MHKPRSLLDDVEKDLLDDKPIASVLRKLVLLGGRAGSQRLRDWASRELRGYEAGDTLPMYRQLPAAIQIDGVLANTIVKHQTVSVTDFPDFVQEDLSERAPIPFGVGEVQAAIELHKNEGVVQLQVPGAPVLAQMIDHGNPFQRTTAVYWSVSTSAMAGLLDQIRTRLAELIGELRAASPTTELPTAQQADNAVNLVINGPGARVAISQVVNGEASDIVVPQRARFWTIGKQVGAAAVGIATILAAVIAWLQLQAG